MLKFLSTIVIVTGLSFSFGCKRSNDTAESRSPESAAKRTSPTPNSSESMSSEVKDKNHADSEDHAHGEVPLGKVTIADLEVELAQGHGKVESGKEGHLVVKLPYNDKGETFVRAWLGSEDRTHSMVGKGEYAPSRDDYDVHAVAPDPLPESVKWWIEIEQPDGKKLIGSADPLVE